MRLAGNEPTLNEQDPLRCVLAGDGAIVAARARRQSAGSEDSAATLGPGKCFLCGLSVQTKCGASTFRSGNADRLKTLEQEKRM